MIDRQNINWVLAVVLSLALHASLFMQFGARSGLESANSGNPPLITRLSFSKPSLPHIESIAESTRIEQPLKHNEPVKKLQNKIPNNTRNKQELIKAEVAKENSPLDQPELQTQGQLAENKSALFLAEQQAYLQQLLAHIESNKFYPRSARSRGLEGDVEVSFDLLADGSVRLLRTVGGHSILQRATRQAVEKSIPLPLSAVESVLPRRVTFTIQYKLQK